MISCKVCQRSFKMLTNSHLKKHGLTPQMYLEAYPGALLCSEEMKEIYRETRCRIDPDTLPDCEHPECAKKTPSKHNKYCSRQCAMSHRMSAKYRGEQSGERNYRYGSDGGWHYLGKKNKALVRKRDQYTCQRCGVRATGKKLHVHHMVPARCFDSTSEAHALGNLVCLCNVCHQKVEWKMFRELYERSLAYESEHLEVIPLSEIKWDMINGDKNTSVEESSGGNAELDDLEYLM